MERTSIERILMERFELTEEDLAAADGKFFDAEGRLAILPAKNKMLLSCGRTRAAEGEFREYELFPEAKKP